MTACGKQKGTPTLIWLKPKRKGLRLWLFKIDLEKVFYSEYFWENFSSLIDWEENWEKIYNRREILIYFKG